MIQESSTTILVVILHMKVMCSLRCDLPVKFSEDLQPSDPAHADAKWTYHLLHEQILSRAACSHGYCGQTPKAALQCIHCSPSWASGLDHPVLLQSVTLLLLSCQVSAFSTCPSGLASWHPWHAGGISTWGAQSCRVHWWPGIDTERLATLPLTQLAIKRSATWGWDLTYVACFTPGSQFPLPLTVQGQCQE